MNRRTQSPRSIRRTWRPAAGLALLSAALADGPPALGQGLEPLSNTTPPYAKWDFVANDGLFATPINGVPAPIQMADPTILKLQDNQGQVWFYVTGTSDEVRTANLEIYRSKDLRTWEFARLAFPPAADCTGSVRPVAVANGSPAGTYTLQVQPRNRGDCAGASNQCVQPTIIDGRAYRHFWSPHLWIDPSEEFGGDHQTVYLAFSAEEVMDAPTDGVGGRRTVYLAMMSKGDFFTYPLQCGQQANRRYFGFGTPGGRLGYKVDGADPLHFDGGHQQSLFEGVPRSIPTSLHAGEHSVFSGPFTHHGRPTPNTIVRDLPAEGSGATLSMGWHHRRPAVPLSMPQGSTVMVDGPFWYKEQIGAYQRRWMLYDWVGFSEPGPAADDPNPCSETDDYDGNNIAAFPMAGDNRRMNSWSGWNHLHIPLAFRYNVHNSFAGVCTAHPVLNGGVIGRWGLDPACPGQHNLSRPTQYYGGNIDGGVAEGAAATKHDGQNRHYLMYTRNPWDQPSYQIVYRFTEPGAHFDALHLGTPHNRSVCEYILVAGLWVSDGAGNPQRYFSSNFGHGQFFWAWGRPYLICHKKLDVKAICADAQCATRTPFQERHIYFKELNFMPDGRIHRLYDGHGYRGKNIQLVNLPSASGSSTPSLEVPSGEIPPYNPCANPIPCP